MWTTLNFTAALVSMLAGQSGAFGQHQVTLTAHALASKPTAVAAKQQTTVAIQQIPASEATTLTLPESLLNIELKSAKGGQFKLSSYKGYVVLIHLWATWCGPCRFETPLLVRLQKAFRSQGLRVIELSTENPNVSGSDVRHYMRTFRVKHRVGWATPEVATALMQGRTAIPQTFLIGGDGRILKRFIGFNAVSTPSLMREAIQEALKTNERM